MVAERWPDPAAVAEVEYLLKTMRAQPTSLTQIAVPWMSLQLSRSETLRCFAASPELAQRLDALEVHVGKLLDLEQECLGVATTKREKR